MTKAEAVPTAGKAGSGKEAAMAAKTTAAQLLRNFSRKPLGQLTFIDDVRHINLALANALGSDFLRSLVVPSEDVLQLDHSRAVAARRKPRPGQTKGSYPSPDRPTQRMRSECSPPISRFGWLDSCLREGCASRSRFARLLCPSPLALASQQEGR